MTAAKFLLSLVLVSGFIILTACSHIFSPETSIARSHPEKLPDGRPLCSECHEAQAAGSLKPYQVFDHTASFVKDHKFSVERDERMCSVCHATSFCNDCHANKIEIKPDSKLGDRPDRELIHRGDYLTRHKIDGKTDPSSCFRCHGRANNAKCVTCHTNKR